MNLLKRLAMPESIPLRTRITVTVMFYVAVALAVLSVTIIHLQRDNFRIRAKETALTVIRDISTTIYSDWDPAKKAKDNRKYFSSKILLPEDIFKNDDIVYVVFQGPGKNIDYVVKSLPEFVWMSHLTKMDPYVERLLAVSGSAVRSFHSYPEGTVTEYMGAVHGKNRKLIGIVRVGVSERNVRQSMGQMTTITLLKVWTVVLFVLIALTLAVFYITSTLESRLAKIHHRASKVLDSRYGEGNHSNVLVQLTNELEEIEGLVNSLKKKFMELATTISHEFRSPMQAIEGYVDLLRQGVAGPVNAEQDKYLQIIGENAERFQGFINNVMDLVRLDGGTFRLESVEFNVKETVSKVSELFSIQAEESKIAISHEVDPEDLSAFGDPNRVYQILVNLITNALKFTPSGGKINIKADIQNRYVRFCVEDTGPGIDSVRQAKLFTEFYQVPGLEPVRGFKGLGIGLALCKKLANAQGGTMYIESMPGEGTKVYFTLPRFKGFKQ